MALCVYDEDNYLDDTFVRLAGDVFNAVSGLMGESNVSAELTLTDEETIRQVNKEARGVDSITDVLSFPSLSGASFPVKRIDYPDDVNPETGELMLGEILLCVKRCREQGEEYGHGFRREFAYLVAHGCLHLYGFDHMTDSDKTKMRAKEEEALSLLKIERN